VSDLLRLRDGGDHNEYALYAAIIATSNLNLESDSEDPVVRAALAASEAVARAAGVVALAALAVGEEEA